MKRSTFTGTSALLLGSLLTLGFAAPSYAQDQQEDKPKQQESGKPQDAKPEHEGKPKQQAEPPKTPNEQPRPEKEREAKPPKQQPQAEQPKTEKQSKQAEKQNEQQQKEQQKQYGQQQSAQQSRGDRGGGRIPDDRFRAHFGREHHFHVGHPQIVEGRPHFEYGGYSFIIVQAWPADWGYDDDVYIVDDGGVYYLCDVAHPGVQLELNVVL
jgi:DNA mismatch repair ATPase MutL